MNWRWRWSERVSLSHHDPQPSTAEPLRRGLPVDRGRSVPRNHIGPTHDVPWISTARLTRFDAVHEGGDLLVDLPALLHQPTDLVDGVDDGRVIPSAELSGDGGIAVV